MKSYEMETYEVKNWQELKDKTSDKITKIVPINHLMIEINKIDGTFGYNVKLWYIREEVN